MAEQRMDEGRGWQRVRRMPDVRLIDLQRPKSHERTMTRYGDEPAGGDTKGGCLLGGC